MNDDFLDEINNSTDELYRISRILRNLSVSFYTVGNHILAEELRELTIGIQLNAEKISHAVSKDVMDNFEQSQRNSVNLLATAMAMKHVQ